MWSWWMKSNDEFEDDDSIVTRPSNNKRPWYNIALISCVIIVVLGVIGFLGLFCIKSEIFTQGRVGVQAVEALYQFNTLEQLESNLPKLKSLTTEEIYNRIAVTNSDKALNVYLKFKKNPVKVEILDKKPGYVLYTLDTGSLSSGRIFLFSYELNWKGEICSVREMECIDFYKNQ